jgi:hypothetical protein
MCLDMGFQGRQLSVLVLDLAPKSFKIKYKFVDSVEKPQLRTKHSSQLAIMGSIGNSAAVKPSKIDFEHEQLGHIVGWTRGTDVVQFRGLPYALIPGRFRQSALNTKLPSQPFLATNPGYDL